MCLALVAHGPLLLNDGLYWDDWLLYPQLKRQDWAAVDALVREAGVTPLNAAFLHLFAYLPGGVFAFKAVAFVFIVCIAWLVMKIAIEAGLSPLFAWSVAALQMVFPGFQDWVLLATAASVFDFVLFLLATLLILRAERVRPQIGLVLRIVAIAAFAASFGFNSLLAMYFGALVLLLIVSLRTAALEQIARRRWPFAVLLVVIPFAYWEISRALLTPSGLYGGFNSFVGGRSMLLSLARFASNGVIDQLLRSIAAIADLWVLPVAFAGLVIAVGVARVLGAPSPSRRSSFLAAAFGLVTLVLAIFPYAAVGKYATVQGWDTRHDLLVAVPVSLVVVALVNAVAVGRRWVLAGSVGVFIAVFAAGQAHTYAGLEARWATDRATMAALQSSPESGRYSVYLVHDEAPGPEDFYRFYEWSAMLGVAYGDQRRIGLDDRAYTTDFLAHQEFFTDRYALANFDPSGCQAQLIVRRAPGAPEGTQLAALYEFDRLFDPGALQHLLDSLLQVVVTPAPGSETCRT
ncbi:MAG TPA: hypothetical protein VJR46_04620 [Candidatus Dormibacteraeota bacterium]|nr:hypothetical protein [Candidatus Dormibacteraeota bacterium]